MSDIGLRLCVKIVGEKTRFSASVSPMTTNGWTYFSFFALIRIYPR